MSYKQKHRKYLPFGTHVSPSIFCGFCVALFFSFLCNASCFVCLRSVSCLQCYLSLGIVYYWLPLLFYRSELFIIDCPFCFISRNCLLLTAPSVLSLGIAYYWLPLLFYRSELFIIDCPFCFLLYLFHEQNYMCTHFYSKNEKCKFINIT